MDDPQRERLGLLLEQALSLPAEERPGFLTAACGAEVALREELATLLAALEMSAGYLEELAEQIVVPALAAAAELPTDEEVIGRTVSHYEILERIGGGGMGVVYKARDLRLGRAVALKFLPPHLTADDSARARLAAEARAASALDHPHIGVVHEIGETEAGGQFIVMGWYEGETLKERLQHGPLSVPEALTLARQIAAALAAAHATGIIHRDVKPSNILITRQGVAKLVDFGIAKMVGTEMTREGATLGTVAYMSPEQTRGQAVDPRTDLWSLGVVLYEMLSGQRPFRGESEETVIYAIRHDEPEPLLQLRPEVPAALASIVETCLRKEPDLRYTQAEELIADLDAPREASPSRRRTGGLWRRPPMRYASLLALLVAILGAALLFRPAEREPGPAAAADRQRVAVLPLANTSPEPQDEYIADGLTEELISHLSRLSGLRVIARTSVMQYRGTDKSAAVIGRELGVGTILEGSARKVADRVRVTVRLVDAPTEEELWSQGYEAELADVIGVQREIAEQVALALQVRIQTGEQHRLARQRVDDPEAYELYLQGRYFLNKGNGEGLKRSEQLFLQALDRDPTYARAWAGLADAYGLFGWYLSVPPEDGYPRARAAAERALELDPGLAEAHATLAATLSNYYWEWEAAERHYRRALELDPNYAAAHQWYAEHLHRLGRVDEALEEAKQARELDPLAPAIERTLADVLYHARRYDEAIAQYHKVRDLYPSYTSVYSHLALAYLAAGRPEEALAAWQELNRHAPGDLGVMAMVGYGYAASGQPAAARAMLERVNERARTEYGSPFHSAALHAVLGDKDRAFELLEQAYERRDILMTYLKMDAVVFAPLRSDPRFGVLLEKVGMAS